MSKKTNRKALAKLKPSGKQKGGADLKVRMVFNIPDDLRKALAKARPSKAGKGGLATRERVKQEITMLLNAHWEDIVYEAETGRACGWREDQ